MPTASRIEHNPERHEANHAGQLIAEHSDSLAKRITVLSDGARPMRPIAEHWHWSLNANGAPDARHDRSLRVEHLLATTAYLLEALSEGDAMRRPREREV